MEKMDGCQAIIERWAKDYDAIESRRQEICTLARSGNSGQLIEQGFPADMAEIMCMWQHASIPDIVGSFLHPEGLDTAHLYGVLNAAEFHRRDPLLNIRLLHLDTIGYRKYTESPFQFGTFGVPLNMFGVTEVGKATAASSGLYAPRSADAMRERLAQFDAGQPSVVQRIFSQIEPHIESAIHSRQVRHKRKELRIFIQSYLRQQYTDLVHAYDEALELSVGIDETVYMSELLYNYKLAVSRRIFPDAQETDISESLFSGDRQIVSLIRETIGHLVRGRGVDFLRRSAGPGEGLSLVAAQNTGRQMLVMDHDGRFKVVGDNEESYVDDEAVQTIVANGLPLAKLFIAALVASGTVYHLGSEQGEAMREQIITALGIEREEIRQYLQALHMGENGTYGNKGIRLKGSRSVVPMPLLYLLLGPQGLRQFVAVRQGRRADALELSAQGIARQAGRYLVRTALAQLPAGTASSA